MSITILLAAMGQTASAEQFAIHRSSEAAYGLDASPLAVVSISPYDDGVLNDGLTHYYLVRDEDDQLVSISAHKNSPQGAVRIAFDDADGLAAAVDPSMSTVALSPAAIPADGLSMARILIIPRDANGVPLGAGLDMEIDTDALYPGFLCGPLVDRGDGSYMLLVASTLPGSGQVWISVEGVRLYAEPTVTFEYAGGASDLRELAKQHLDGLIIAGGPLDNVLAVMDPADPRAGMVWQAWDEIIAGLELLNEDDYRLDYIALDIHLSAALSALAAALEESGGADAEVISTLIDDLLDAGRMIAQFHLNRAGDSCGSCEPGEGGHLCGAEQALANGDAERASGDPECEKVLDRYIQALKKALDAYDHCAD